MGNLRTSLDVEEVEEEVDDHRSMNSLVAHRDSGHPPPPPPPPHQD